MRQSAEQLFSGNAITQMGYMAYFVECFRQMGGVPPGCTCEPGRVRRLGDPKSRFPEDLAPLADELIE
jgi:hypothetical protein